MESQVGVLQSAKRAMEQAGRKVLWSGISPQKFFAARVLPRPSRTLDKFNWNARWMGAVKAAGKVPLFPLRDELHTFIHQEYSAGGPIDYLEFGVWRGESLRFWCNTNKHPESRFAGFDSFEGLPEDWSADRPKGYFSTDGKLPDIRDDRLEFVVGWFQNVLPGFLSRYKARECPLIIHCDADLYSSTLYLLTSLNGIIRPGTVLIFDEFDVMMDEYRALVDWANAFIRTYKIVAATNGFRQTAVLVTG